MKTLQKLLALSLCLCALLVLPLTAHATGVSGNLSDAAPNPGDSFTLTVSMDEATVSSLGVEVHCENARVTGGTWLQNGLMASFDTSKNKGVFSPGGAAALSGSIFRLSLEADNPGSGSVSVTLIGKNGIQEVFRQTVSRSFTVACPEHQFGSYESSQYLHWQFCSVCGLRKTGQHRMDGGVLLSESSCTQAGQMRHTCLDCGYSYNEDMELADHQESDWILDAAAQVGIPGSRHTECAVCHKTMNTQQIPALEPEVTEPEVTEPEVTEPEVTEPEITEPEVTEPEITEPEATEPEVTEPEVTEPEVTEPEATEPEVTEPEVTEPEATEPEVTEPEVTEPEVTEPEVTEPVTDAPQEDTPSAPEESQPEAPKFPLPLLILSGVAVLAVLVLLFKRK